MSEEKIQTTADAVAEAVIQELLDYFSDARVTGIKLLEHEAHWIASGVVRRVSTLAMSLTAGMSIAECFFLSGSEALPIKDMAP